MIYGDNQKPVKILATTPVQLHRTFFMNRSRREGFDSFQTTSVYSIKPHFEGVRSVSTLTLLRSCRALRVVRSSDFGVPQIPRAACHFEPAASDVARWQRALDVFILPARSEALSNSLTEAIACGCFPVASDVGGNPEPVIPMEAGL
jgi:glycosyltransferase involved in cell wall biosynthesis